MKVPRMIIDDHRLWCEKAICDHRGLPTKIDDPLCDFFVSYWQPFDLPSLTVEMLPGDRDPQRGNSFFQTILLGTSRLQRANAMLIRAELEIHDPTDDQEDEEDDETGSKESRDPKTKTLETLDDAPYGETSIRDFYSSTSTNILNKLPIIQKIYHDGEVKRARCMPQQSSLIATKTDGPYAYVFDTSKHPSEPDLPDGVAKPDLILEGHSSGGFGLSWSPLKKGYLLSGDNDSQICLWDINATPTDKALDALATFKIHDGPVADVSWHMKYHFLFGSVGADKFLKMYDTRSSRVIFSVPHKEKVTCMSFNPENERQVATGSADGTVKVFDVGSSSRPCIMLDFHRNAVSQVAWNPSKPNILASSCHGGRISLWDIDRKDAEQTAQEARDGPPELVFLHRGHSDRVNDFSWCPLGDHPLVACSIALDIQVWKPRKGFFIC